MRMLEGEMMGLIWETTSNERFEGGGEVVWQVVDGDFVLVFYLSKMLSTPLHIRSRSER